MESLVQIQLIDTNQGYLDLADGTNFPINFGISDVRDLTKRKGTTSKTIKLAGSKNNNKLLNNYFDVNVIAGTFDINQLQRCAVIQDGIVILDDVYLQLTKVVKTQTTGAHDQLVSYEVVIKDSTSDFFTVIGNAELTDLQLQTQETYHQYTTNNVVDSWNHTWEDVYKYVMPVNTSSNSYTLNQWVPGIYAKQYWNKIFEGAGYTYEWAEHTGTTQQFDKLIIPFNGDQSELTAEVLDDLQIIAINTGATEYTKAQATNGTAILFQHNATFPIEVEDEQGYYNPGTSTYTNAFYLQGSNTLQYEFEIDYQLILRNQAGSTATAVQGTNYNAYIKITKNGVSSSYNNLSILGTSASLPAGSTIPAGDFILRSETVTRTLQLSNLNVGDYHNFFYLILPNGGGQSSWDRRVDIVLKINSIRMKIVPKIEMLGYTFPVFLNTFVPKKIKQSDFIKAFVTRYNLYIEIDKFNSNNLIIKTRDKYYDDGKEENWTKLLNKDREQELQFLPELAKKKFKLTDKQDSKDAGLNIYFETTSQIYGESQFTFDNEYTKDVEVKETIFSPTIITDENIFGAVTPSFVGPNPKMNIRLLYDGGMFPCNDWYIYNYGTTGTSGLTQYPLFSHQNDPLDPTFDINFGQCGYYAIENLGLTNNNMYNLHWRRTLNQMNSSKMLTAFFDLKASDIQKMKLSDKIRIDNSWWNINKIVDYNPTKEGPTKVELLSIDVDTQFSPFNTWVQPIKPTKPTKPVLPTRGGWGMFDKEVKNANKEGLDFSNIVNGNIGSIEGSNNFVGDPSTNGVIYGDNNISDFGGFILGDNNTSNSNVFIYGSGNFIPEGMGNTMVIGNDIILDTGSTSNTMYVDNVNVISSFTMAPGSTLNISGVTISGLEYLPLSGGTMDNGASISSFSSTATSDNLSWGNGNTSNGSFTAIIGGQNNLIDSTQSFIGGGQGNTSNATANYSFIGGGINNTINGQLSSVIGGYGNIINGYYSFIGGGLSNSATTSSSSVIGGVGNTASGSGSFIGGGGFYAAYTTYGNTSSGENSGIIGGLNNTASGNRSFIGGGGYNTSTAFSSSVIGGFNNHATQSYSSIVGGGGNTASGYNTFVAGGANNSSTNSYSSVVGGTGNNVSGQRSSVVGGLSNVMTGTRSVILGGQNITGTTNDTVYVPSISFQNEPENWVFISINIGDWNMDATASVNVAHGLSATEWKTIRGIDIIVRNDDDTGYYPLIKGYDGVTGNGFINVIGSTNITLNRVTAGNFDNTYFDSTSYNRGWITFWYQPDA